jgi:hypothetical protein
MGYLSEFEHDIFVSYAHSDLLNDWSRRLIDEMRKLVAGGLGLRSGERLGVWWDYNLRGNQPLTDQLRKKVEGGGLLLVLMSNWYLDSAWCQDERDWFMNAVRQRSADRVFVVRVCATNHARWPKSFKDQRGHPLVGYDFARDADDEDLRLPKGHPRPEDASDSREYYAALEKLARDIVSQLKALKRAEFPAPVEHRPGPGLKEQRERVFLAAVPEDVHDLRDELAGLLCENSCVVTPETNPLDLDELLERAPEWISNCDKFVQVLGSFAGAWRHDDSGFVMYQHELARKSNKPIFIYRGPLLNASQVKKPEYREFLQGLDQDDTGGLESFAQRVVRFTESPPNGDDACQSVFMMASERDQNLEREIRRLLKELHIDVYPLPRAGQDGREVVSVLNEGSSFLDVVRRCGAILLINGNVKEVDLLWIDGRVADIKFDIQRKLGGRVPYAIVDAPPDPRLEQCDDVCVFPGDSPTLKHDLQGWLRQLGAPAVDLGTRA